MASMGLKLGIKRGLDDYLPQIVPGYFARWCEIDRS
jgi:hypothetical protein